MWIDQFSLSRVGFARFRRQGNPMGTNWSDLAKLLSLAFLISFAGFSLANGDGGTYRNPVLFGDYSDPDIVRVGDDYYLVSSSFQAVPALPILHSRDLVNWTIV